MVVGQLLLDFDIFAVVLGDRKLYRVSILRCVESLFGNAVETP